MNTEVIQNPDFMNHQDKCRCCFRHLQETDKFVKIDENLTTIFYDLTQIELIPSDELSSRICQFCSRDLQIFSTFRTNLISNQLKLYSHIQSLQDREFLSIRSESSPPTIKTEKDDDDDTFINCAVFLEKKPENSKATAKKCCSFCGSLVNNYRRHILKVHFQVKNFFCDLCGYASFFRYDMEQHMKVHIKKATKPPKVFGCDACGLDFPQKSLLNAHVKAKHTEKVRSHICHICSKAFYSSENLKKHVDSHNAKDMPCEFCGKLFSCINNLRTHLYYHAEPKFVCDVAECGKKFFMRKRLRAHMKTHANQKDFLCSYCDKSYFSNNDLNCHIVSIHQKLRFFCEEPGCSGNFSRRGYYRKHVMTYHQNVGPKKLEILLQRVRHAVPSQTAPDLKHLLEI